MSITVKVVFIGLVGFVPSPEGQDNIAALLINPTKAEKSSETECPTPKHLSMVVLLNGRCESGDSCYRGTNNLVKHARKMELGTFIDRFPQLLVEKQEQGGGREKFGLIWLLDGEDIDISGDADDDLDVRNFLATLVTGAAPRSAGQSSYFSWVPSMKKLTKGQAEIKYDCLQANKRCPLYARFTIDGGDVKACHMFHDPSNSQGVERDVRIFDYLIPGQRFIERQAVADAVQVEFHEESNSVVLESKSLPGRTLQSNKALLSPDSDGRLTLIVANLPHPCPTTNHSCHRAHSDVFFQLLKSDGLPRPIRVMSEERRRVDPGPCEKEMEQFEMPFKGVCTREYPHSVTACDGTRFPKPGQ